ncbi:alpha/beta hydrolase protein [Auricularia subglabra TFB-10046 SS5]|uniref:Alpha/beta hydrolase protein n=1 Tax=Auricularia subglabra (strain TFB-10046 / SS5) TaxID=717982 RepID=J0WVW1_AURST|nr:alpha/beta hydrolase protein [Auricularia subglabra TFB-10046 SS5]
MNGLAIAEGDFTVREFTFQSGERLPELRLHYRTLGALLQRPNPSGTHTSNAVLILHGTTGSGAGFLTPEFAGVLFTPGGLLDAQDYFIVLPDGIGHGGSSKPSDGLGRAFPKYTYDDMVRAQYLLLTEHLGVRSLRLALGTSMGGMHVWTWAHTYPDFVDALMPLASQPVMIAGLNRMRRKIILDALSRAPADLLTALGILREMTATPRLFQKQWSTRESADAALEEYLVRGLQTQNADDMLYAFDSSREYDPAPHLEKIVAPLVAINSADDVVNPPELGVMEANIKRVKRGRYVLIPASDATRGHGTHSLPAIWQDELHQLLSLSKQ